MAGVIAERADNSRFSRREGMLLQRPVADGLTSTIGLRNNETRTQRDLREIGVLQNQFDRALGRKYDQEDTLVRSYNPVIDRWRIERLRTENDKDGEDAYVQEIRTNLETNLKERMQVGDNTVIYKIKDGELYSSDFPKEPFSQVLKRGAEYRLQHGTPEAKREEAERIGFKKITSRMTDPDTPVGTKITSFSPKGIVEGTSYDRNIVDEYELIEDISGRHVKLTRRMVDFDEADYLSYSIGLDPNYFDKYDNEPIDAWMLAHPVEGNISNLEMLQTGISSEVFNKISDSQTLKKVIDYYLDRIQDENADWKQIAISFNAFLNQADEEKKVVMANSKQDKPVYLSPELVRETVNRMGIIEPIKMGGGGCPPNKGYNVSNGSVFMLGGSSVAVFAGVGGSVESDDKGPLEFKCNNGHMNRRPKGQLIPSCTTCGESVSC